MKNFQEIQKMQFQKSITESLKHNFQNRIQKWIAKSL